MAKRTRAAAEPSGQELHNRVTRGEVLSDTERTALQAWYDAEDAAETRVLGAGRVAPDALRADVDAAIVRLRERTQGLQRLSEQNAGLRRENAALTRRLMRTTQAA